MGFVDNMLGTNIFGENSTDKAINAQTDAMNSANATMERMYNQQREDLKPFREIGLKGLTDLSGDFMKDWQQDPGYQFRMQQGANAINSSASARGNSLGGATLKALARYGQDYASNEYNNVYNRNFNRLSQLAGIGSGTNTQLVNAAGQFGQGVANNQIGLGNAIASANIAQANNQSNLLGQGMQAAAFASDEKLKTNLEPISKEDIKEMKKHLKAFYFNYKSNEFGDGDWAGIMAQDLEKSKLGKTLVVEDERGNKFIDMKKVLSMFLATMAAEE